MSRDHSVVSAKGALLWSLGGLNVMILIAGLITHSYLLIGLSIAISLIILALTRHARYGASHFFHTRMRSTTQMEPGDGKQVTSLGVQDTSTLPGHEWLAHSVFPVSIENKDLRVIVGNAQCSKPYSLSLLNIGAASGNDLSDTPISVLNRGAAIAHFAHNTGDKGISPDHLNGGDLVWQIGTGYCGCSDDNAGFFPELFKINAALPTVKMIELKLPLKDQSTFSNPVEMIRFLGVLRQLSDGKPVGFNIRIGNKHEFIDICNAIQVTRIIPDFITVVGTDGCTANIGVPLYDALAFVKQTLEVFNLREYITMIAAGNIATPFDILKVVALGADACYCTEALTHVLDDKQLPGYGNARTGIAPMLARAPKKSSATDHIAAVSAFHRDTIYAVTGIMEDCGFRELKDIDPAKFFRKIDPIHTRSFKEIYLNPIDDRLINGWFKACMLN